MKRCIKCILPETGLNIDFDEKGLCNFCRTYEKHKSALTDFSYLEPLLHERLERVRGKHKYDCLVGLSGGKDSSYVAYTMCKEYGLKTLLVTYDNGFLTDYARENIRQVVKNLGQDHVFLTPDAKFYPPIYRSSMKRFGVPCPGCTFPAMLMCIKVAIEEDIPLLVHGRSRPQMFKELTDGSIDPFLRLIYGNLKPFNIVENNRVMKDVVRRLTRLLESSVPDRKLRTDLYTTFCPDRQVLDSAYVLPEALGLFLYREYDELAIIRTLEVKLNWNPPETVDILTHQDCFAHEAAAFYYTKVCAQPMICQELSSMIREGAITRDEALERLQREEPHLLTYPAQSIRQLGQVANLAPWQLDLISEAARMKVKLLKSALKAKNIILKRSELPIPTRPCESV